MPLLNIDHVAGPTGRDAGRWDGLYGSAGVLAGLALLASVGHFWPFEDNALWKLCCPSNVLIAAWCLLVLFGLAAVRKWDMVRGCLPDISVSAFVAISVLSLAFSANEGRSINFLAKLMLMFFGGYSLFSFAARRLDMRKTLYGVAVAGLLVAVVYCLTVRLAGESESFGFHGNAYKYGTFVGMLAPLGCVYLFLSEGRSGRVGATVLAVASVVSVGTAGAMLAIMAGIGAVVVLGGRNVPRAVMIIALILCLVSVGLLWHSSMMGPLRDDMSLYDPDGVNVKQRYIEWQAELNLLEEFAAAGAGAGCINEYRSKFYHRLPKTNAIKPFDQNGWLTTAAETGVLGLVCFCWLMLSYVRRAVGQIGYARKIGQADQMRCGAANLAGLVGAGVAHTFSSVCYSGILIVFVFILAMTAAGIEGQGEAET